MIQKNPLMERDYGSFFSLDQWMNNRTIHSKYVLITQEEIKDAFRSMRTIEEIDEMGLPSCGLKNDMSVWLISDVAHDAFTDREDTLIQNWIYRRAEAIRKQRPEEQFSSSDGIEDLLSALEENYDDNDL